MSSKNKDLTVGKPSKVIFRFCLPLFASIIFQQLYNLADSYVCGRFVGENALAAVGNSYEITLVLIAFAFGANIGCSVIVSRLFGAKEYGKVKTAVYTALISVGVLCATLMLLSFAFGNTLLGIIHTPADIFADSKLYLDIYILGLPFVFFYNLSNGIFSALGDSKTPFIFLACSSIANIILDVLFTTRFVGFFRNGVAGVAWATFICQGISCILAVIYVIMRMAEIKPEGKTKVFSAPLLWDMTKIAVPSIIQQSFVSVGNIFIQSFVNPFGTGVIAGYAAAIKLNNLVVTSLTTVGTGISNFTSQNIGARQVKRIKEGYKAGLKLVLYLVIPFMLLYFFFGKYLILFFLNNPSEDALSTGIIILRIVSPFYYLIASKLIADGVLRGAGTMREFMFTTFMDLFMRVVIAWILSRTSLGSLGIWISWPFGWATSSTMSIFFYFKARWIKFNNLDPNS